MRWPLLLLACLAAAFAAPACAQSLGTAFTYQGALKDAGVPANGNYDFRFQLYGAETGGAALGTVVERSGVAVTAGSFSLSLDFGEQFFGQRRWLAIEARRAGVATYTPLTPRQPITPAPFALHAEFVADGAITASSVQSRSLSGDRLQLGSVGSSELAAGAVGSMALADGSVTFPKIAEGAVGSTKIADGSVGAQQVNRFAVQLRLSAQCPRGVPLIGISEAGLPICDHPSRTLGIGSQRVSVALRSDGRPLVARDGGNLHDCADANCSSGTDIVLNLGTDVAMSLRSDGRPVIATGSSNQQFLVICGDAVCSPGSRVQRLLDTGGFGVFSMLALRPDNTPIVAYFDFGSGQTRLYVCADPSCASGTIRVITPSAQATPSALRIRPNGTPVIALRDYIGGPHLLYDCNDAGCSSGTQRPLSNGGSIRFLLGLAVRSDNRPLITNGGPTLHDCVDAGCSSHTQRSFDAGETILASAIALRSDGRPLLLYATGFGMLKLFDCADSVCSTGSVRVIDQVSSTVIDREVAIALRPDGRPVIAYPIPGGQLRLVSCATVACQ